MMIYEENKMGFRKISVGGSHEEIGFQYGNLLKKEIHKNIEFYIPYMKSILRHNYSVAVGHFNSLVKKCFPHLYAEMEHIALSADVEIDDLIAMNSRTEMLLSPISSECTGIVSPRHGLLAQNWDWSSKLEETSIIIEITYSDGHKILMLIEAGIVGKIGLNSRHIGVAMNILRREGQPMNGPPIHLIMRGILEQKTLEQAISYIRSLGAGTSSNLIVSDGYNAFDVEYAGYRMVIQEIKEAYYTHTNHFLHQEDEAVFVAEEDFEDSAVRYETANSKLSHSAAPSARDIKKILSDQSRHKFNVLADYEPYLDDHMGLAGTLATIVMDLRKGVMEVRKGNPSMAGFEMDQFKTYRVL
jgi:isopenicillin-N N-acyltransferase-like protein